MRGQAAAALKRERERVSETALTDALGQGLRLVNRSESIRADYDPMPSRSGPILADPSHAEPIRDNQVRANRSRSGRQAVTVQGDRGPRGGRRERRRRMKTGVGRSGGVLNPF